MNILFVISSSNYGGAERYVTLLAEMLKKAGHRAFFYRNPFGRNDDLPGKYAEADIVTAIRNSVSPCHLLRIQNIVRKYDIDLIHTHLSKGSVLGGLAAKLCRIPSVASVHGMNDYRDYRFNTHMFAVSGTVREKLISTGASSDRITVIHNGVKENHYRRCEYRNGDTLKLLFAGRLSREKGADILISALAGVESDSILKIAGEGSERERLEELACKTGMGERVEFCGFVEDIYRLMADSHILIQPSRKEGFGLSAAEAFACGLPVIASDTGGLGEIVSHGKNGLLFSPGDTEALARSINQTGDAETLKRMSREALKEYKDRFSTETMFERTLKEYERLIKDSYNHA